MPERRRRWRRWWLWNIAGRRDRVSGAGAIVHITRTHARRRTRAPSASIERSLRADMNVVVHAHTLTCVWIARNEERATTTTRIHPADTAARFAPSHLLGRLQRRPQRSGSGNGSDGGGALTRKVYILHLNDRARASTHTRSPALWFFARAIARACGPLCATNRPQRLLCRRANLPRLLQSSPRARARAYARSCSHADRRRSSSSSAAATVAASSSSSSSHTYTH